MDVIQPPTFSQYLQRLWGNRLRMQETLTLQEISKASVKKVHANAKNKSKLLIFREPNITFSVS